MRERKRGKRLREARKGPLLTSLVEGTATQRTGLSWIPDKERATKENDGTASTKEKMQSKNMSRNVRKTDCVINRVEKKVLNDGGEGDADSKPVWSVPRMERLHDHTLATLRWRSVWVLPSSNRAPDGWYLNEKEQMQMANRSSATGSHVENPMTDTNEMIFCRFAVLDQATGKI